MSVRDIQMFISFANFYRRFIQGFTKIAAPFTFLLKTTKLSDELAPKAFKANDNKVVGGGSSRVNETVMNSSKKLTRVLNIEAIEEPTFLTLNIKKVFNQLRLAFIKAPIFRHFDLKSHICIETDASSYAIGRMLSQLNFDSDTSPNDPNLKSDFNQ